MNNIPQGLKKDMATDPFYNQCCITGGGVETDNKFDSNRIEWHHNLIFAGKQVQEKWCILPLKKYVHDSVESPTIKELCNWIMYNRATDEELNRYSKVKNLFQEKRRLNEKYGEWKPGIYMAQAISRVCQK